MNIDTTLDFDSLTSEQQQKLNDLFAGIQYLREDVWTALSDPELMTQELFNYIQLRRLEIGPELENIAMDVFLKYPDYAIDYTDRLEKAIIATGGYDEIRQRIILEFGYDIGPLEKMKVGN